MVGRRLLSVWYGARYLASLGVVLGFGTSCSTPPEEPAILPLQESTPAADADIAAKAKLFADRPTAAPPSTADTPVAATPQAPPTTASTPTTADPVTPVKAARAGADNADAAESVAAKFFAETSDADAAPKSRVLELRLRSLSDRVRRMHEAWSAESDEWSSRAMEMESRRLASRLDPVVKRAETKATVSVHVRHLQAQRVLYDHNGEQLRNPASNQKMLTASAALDLLGPEFRFDTRALRSADTLFLVGGGDPTLTVDKLTQYATELARDTDLSRITRLVIDESAFSPERFIPGFVLDDIGLVYAAPTGALSLSDNAVGISITPGVPGENVRVHVEPNNRYISLDVRARTVAADDGGENAIYVRTKAQGDQTIVEVIGQMRAGDKPLFEKRRIYDPGLFTAQSFVSALTAAWKRETLPIARGITPPDAHLLRSWSSLPLIDVARNTLAFSNNFATEQILRTLAQRMGGVGSFEQGKRILELYWRTVGVNPNALIVDNGSGLTHEGRFTARGLVDLLSAAHLVQPPNSGLLSVLPVAGQPGTLRSRQLQARGRLRAKTGTLNGVSALTGVLTAVNGDPVLALSIMQNPSTTNSLDVGARHATEEDIVRVLLDYVDEKRNRERGPGRPRTPR